MQFIAVDPGAMCGLLQYDDETTVKYQIEHHPYRTIQLIDEITRGDVVLVVEKYLITPMTHKLTRQYDALETIGALRYVAMKHSWTFELQPTSVKDKVHNSTLRTLGWYQPSRGDHMNDAARHAFVALCRHRPHDDLVKRALGMIGSN